MNPSMSLVYLPPHLERSQPFPRVGHQLSSPDNSQEMSWPPPYSYARGTVSNASDDQQLYPAMNRLPTSYNMPFYPSTQYMERESSQSQCTLQSNTPFSHDAGLDLSNRPAVPRRRTREDSDSASVSGSAPYGSTDSNQVDGHHLSYASQSAPTSSPHDMTHASNPADSAVMPSSAHSTREEVSFMPAPNPSQVSPYTFTPTHTRAASDSSTTTATSSSSHPRSASPATSVVSVHTVSSTVSAPQGKNDAPNPESSPAAARKHKKQRLYNVDRKRICEYHNMNPNAKQEDIARQFKVERSTISKILKHKDKWLNVPTDTPILVARDKPTKFPMLDEQLKAWLRECTHNKVILTDAMIRGKALEFATIFGWDRSKFKASSGWVENFKHRWGIRKGMWMNYVPLAGDDGITARRRANGDGFNSVAAAQEAQRRAEEATRRDGENMQPDIGLSNDDSNDNDYTGSDRDDDGVHDMSLGPAWPMPSTSQMPMARSMGPPPQPSLHTDSHLPEHDYHYSRPIPGMSYFDNIQNRALSFAPDRPQLNNDREPIWVVRSAIDGLNKVFDCARTKEFAGLISNDQWTTLRDVKERLKNTEDSMQEPQTSLYP